MTNLLAQHGAAKGRKISDGINEGNLKGAIFSQNDEKMESITRYLESETNLNKNNTFLDPQFYYSTFESSILKKLSDIEEFPSNIERRDWRKKDEKILRFLDYHAKKSQEISNTLIVPGFYIENIDWHFDYSVEMYNFCVDKYDSCKNFKNFSISLLINTTFFNNSNNVKEIIEELNEMCEKKDYIYLVLCHNDVKDINYEEMDINCLSNILYMIHELKKIGFKFLIGYTFMNSLLFAMLDCEYVASGWFNTLRKFQTNRFGSDDGFGRRKKRYTSLPLLTYIMFDDIKTIEEIDDINIDKIKSYTKFENEHTMDEEFISFVDLEHQYWQSLNKKINEINKINDVNKKINLMKNSISEALELYQLIIQKLIDKDEKEAVNRLRKLSKHLNTWLAAIDEFKRRSLLI